MINDNSIPLYKKHEELTEFLYNNPGMLPHRYVFVLTTKCNLNCSFCNQVKSKKNNSLPPDQWINLTKQLPEYARVTITGGEPLIYRDFKKVFSYVAKRFTCNIITNGTLLTKELIDYVLSFPNFAILAISIDNIGNTIRGLHQNQWKKLFSSIEYFHKQKNIIKSKCILDIKTMVLDQNSYNLFNIHKFCVEKFGCDTHGLQLLKGSPLQHATVMYDAKNIFKHYKAPVYSNFEIIMKELEKIREYTVNTGTKVFMHPKVLRFDSIEKLSNTDYVNSPDFIKNKFENCIYPWANVHINEDGTLYPCLAVPMGNITRETLIKIINSDNFNNFRRIIKNEGIVLACNRCGWLKPKLHI